jgi:hypothetical protein
MKRAASTGLEHCPSCKRDFVNPLEWGEAGDDGWWIELRCGNCGMVREVTVSNEVAERFDEELNRNVDVIARAAHRLDLERMLAQVESFTAALQRGLIDAVDFAR